MNIFRTTLAALAVVVAFATHAPAEAQGGGAAAAASAAASAPAEGSADEVGPGTEYSEKGADTCLNCHDEEADTLTFITAGIFKSRHGSRVDRRSPFGPGGLQCEACHGPGAKHSSKGSKKVLTTNSFKPNSFMPVAERNDACLACHRSGSRKAWHATAHDRAELACTDCHRLHVGRDAVLVKTTESQVCMNCHKKQRADFQKASTHPVRSGNMSCSDCHSPHGSSSVAMLVKPTLNQTCYSCHAEKRGPLLWEHAPVAEDCSLCHTAHGSVRAALLDKSPPLLCQECHSAAGHPSVPRTGAALPGGGGGGSIFVVAGGCTNCHSQVHGSNHPAGAKLMR